MTSEKLLKDILQNQLNLDCTTISLTQKSQNGSVSSFCGPGYIYQNIEGGLEFKIYCAGILDPKVFFSQMNQFTSGKLIEEHQIYKLEAADIHGHRLEAYSIIPKFNGGAEIEGYTVSGDCSKLFGFFDTSVVCKGTFIKIYYKNKYKIPSNITKQTDITIGKEKRGQNLELSGAQFHSDDFDFEVLSEDDCTILSIFSENIIDPFVIAQRANEAFHFVLAQNEQMIALAIDHKQSKDFIIFKHQVEVIKPKAFPPRTLGKVDRNGDHWKLFVSYFTYSITYKNEGWHPIYRLIHDIIESSKASFDIHALTLSVAIEGILKHGFTHLATPSDNDIDAIKCAKKIIDESEIQQNLIPRLIGALGAMHHPRPKDMLFVLKETGVIEKKHFKAWEYLRNTTAHSEELDTAKYQKIINSLNQLYVLFYLLIFDLIGYSGSYTDYGTYNFPDKSNEET